MFKWFSPNLQTVEELKKEYKTLVKKYHPDLNNGNYHEEMIQINLEYEQLLTYIQTNFSDNKHNAAHSTDDGFREIIVLIIHLENITIEIIGSWLWITGSTYQYREYLKSIGLKWQPKKSAWYWTNSEKKRYTKTMSMDHIRSKYGSIIIENEKREKIAG
jgi:hypothetical protein